MKKILIYSSIVLGSMGLFTSCKKFLDVNKNPNSPTDATPQLIMGQAITYSASNTVSYQDYGAWMVGYTANAGGYGGWGSAFTYDYANTAYNGLWNGSYDNMEDYHVIQTKTEGDDRFAYYNAVARIMKVYHFQFLVDTYNDIPYFNALKGVSNVYPSYDEGEVIYQDLYKQIDTAVNLINNAVEPITFAHQLGNADPMFSSNMTQWKRLANTLKLRLLIRASGTNAFSGITPTFDPVGFLTTDALVNPGYVKNAGQQSPFWSTYHSSVTDGGAARSLITSYYALTFYNGTKILDEPRAKAIYRGVFTPARNQTAVNDDNVPIAPAGSSAWYSGNGASWAFGNNYDSAVGVLKGRSQSQPILTAAESYFLQAEAVMKGLITSSETYESLFNKGILASYSYLFTTQNGSYKPNSYFSSYFGTTGPTAAKIQALVDQYHTDNATNYLVNIGLATTPAQRLEAIITQKYVALNMIHGHEAWAEFRRTGYPTINNSLPLNRDLTFVSVLSQSTTPDRTIGRLLYPSSEYQLNSDNVPTGVSVFGSYVFWDRRN